MSEAADSAGAAMPRPGDGPSQFAATIAVLERHRLDEAALDALLREQLPDYGGELVLRQFPGGFSNPTYFLQFASRDGGVRELVLRKKPAGQLLKSAHQVEREYRVMSALAGSGLPLPRTLLCLPDGNPVLGQAFYLMQCVPGRIFTDPTLPGLPTSERAAIYDSMNQVLAQLHALDHRAHGLGEFERPGSFLERQVELWTRQYRAAQTGDIAAMETLIRWLPAHLPADARSTITHGDYKLANLVVHPTEPRVVAMLDWELWTIGDPLCDLGFNCLMYHLADPPAGLAGNDLPALGIPQQADYVAAYCRRTGRDGIDHWPFYLVLNLFKLAAILQGVYKRALDGSASSEKSLEQGRKAAHRAELAVALIG